MTGHVFISYRHGEEDAAYVEKLATFLTAHARRPVRRDLRLR